MIPAVIVTVLNILFLSKYTANISGDQNQVGIGKDVVDHISIVNKAFDEWMEIKHSQVASPPKNSSVATTIPTKTRPFLFFHLRKAGGSSLRTIIHNAATMTHIPKEQQWIPCETDPCVPFSYPPNTPKTIYASHINYDVMVSLFREANTVTMNQIKSNQGNIDIFDERSNQVQHFTYHTLGEMHDFDCITNIRSTVDRVVSCWNYRFVQNKLMTWNIPSSSQVTPDEWRILLPQIYDEYNGGCNNEFIRIFGSVMDETIVNSITVDSPSFLPQLDLITSRISKCAIVSTEDCEGSNRILAHFFPWLHSTNLCTTKANRGEVDSTDLMEGVKEAIIEQNYMDDLVYRFAMKIFNEQLDIANKNLK